MAYNLPTFNLLADVWYAGKNPAADDPDAENVPLQFYLASKGTYDVDPCDNKNYTPPIWLRMPMTETAIWTSGQVWEVPAETGRYYRARFKDVMHLGFPNQYLIAVVVQCNAEGLPLIRDVEGETPCGDSDEADGGGTISVAVGILCEGEGSAGGEPDAFGDGTILIHLQADVDGAGHTL